MEYPTDRPDITNLLEMLKGGEPHSPDNCGNPGCPMRIYYNEIAEETEDGWMFDVENLLVWVWKAEGQMDRDEKWFSMPVCEAARRNLD